MRQTLSIQPASRRRRETENSRTCVCSTHIFVVRPWFAGIRGETHPTRGFCALEVPPHWGSTQWLAKPRLAAIVQWNDNNNRGGSGSAAAAAAAAGADVLPTGFHREPRRDFKAGPHSIICGCEPLFLLQGSRKSRCAVCLTPSQDAMFCGARVKGIWGSLTILDLLLGMLDVEQCLRKMLV